MRIGKDGRHRFSNTLAADNEPDDDERQWSPTLAKEKSRMDGHGALVQDPFRPWLLGSSLALILLLNHLLPLVEHLLHCGDPIFHGLGRIGI